MTPGASRRLAGCDRAVDQCLRVWGTPIPPIRPARARARGWPGAGRSDLEDHRHQSDRGVQLGSAPGFAPCRVLARVLLVSDPLELSRSERGSDELPARAGAAFSASRRLVPRFRDWRGGRGFSALRHGPAFLADPLARRARDWRLMRPPPADTFRTQTVSAWRPQRPYRVAPQSQTRPLRDPPEGMVRKGSPVRVRNTALSWRWVEP